MPRKRDIGIFLWGAACMLLAVAAMATTYTTITSVAIINSIMDSTVIGGNVPAAGSFTTVNSSSGFTGNLTGSVTGNASTATALAASPTQCTAPQFAEGVTTSGNANCATPTSTGNFGIKTGGTCSTTNSAGNTCTVSVNLNVSEPDTNYAVSCTGVGPTGAPFIQAVSKSTGSVTVTIVNGTASQAIVSTYSEMDCVIQGT